MGCGESEASKVGCDDLWKRWSFEGDLNRIKLKFNPQKWAEGNFGDLK